MKKVLSTVLILCFIFLAACGSKSELSGYANEAIKIAEDYAAGSYDYDGASTRLDMLRDKVKAYQDGINPDKDSSSYSEHTRAMALASLIQSYSAAVINGTEDLEEFKENLERYK